jgi:methionyl-tRNA formyltransferase
MTIYHFTNLSFGAPFLAVWHGVKLKDTDKVVIILSQKKRSNSLSRVLIGMRNRYLAWLLRRHIGNVRIYWETDINRTGFLKKIRPDDVSICTGFNQIFSPELLALFKVAVNIHPSILPYYRGPVPSYWCLLHGEQRSGYTLHRMTRHIDLGEILFQEDCAILEGDTPELLDERIAQLASPTFRRFVVAIFNQNLWKTQFLDASKIYKTVTNYKSFP